MTFTEDDLKTADQFAKTFAKATFTFTVTDWLVFHKQLVWYNGMLKRMHDNILEVKKIHDDPVGD